MRGNLLPECLESQPLRVYPRVCGGTSLTTLNSSSINGLSPRVRGNRMSGTFSQPRRGSIPACAGEPDAGADVFDTAGVYPRVCGGTHHCHIPALIDKGLSPRVRGNRDITSEPSSPPWVYPRVCGGTHLHTCLIRFCTGLSPRVRGNPTHARTFLIRLGSIPACAGEPITVISRR